MSKVYWLLSIMVLLSAVAHADNNPYSPENNPYSTRNNPYTASNNRYNMGSFVRESSSISAAPAARVQLVPDLPDGAIGIINTYNAAGEIIGARLVIINGEQ